MGILTRSKNEYGTSSSTTTGTGTGVGHHNNANDNPYTNGNATLGNGGINRNEGPLGHRTGQGVSGTGSGMTGRNGVHPAPVAGAGHVNTGPAPLHGVASGSAPSTKEAIKLEKKGKKEQTIGKVLHSTSMKEKGATHLAQADHMHMQASELSEAERLEHEAGMRRQRAVGLGADPTHAHGHTGHGPHTTRI
ncbi:uncharacterized protein IL334_005213 [Kwoniella shivajii]|uniref:Uncharacterized protein n=1 Tax=Kwoniella shivajii TaxID=564305 RepID=A0ABZ1D3R0_9TREE|nr:hypothetical protein IL334_005213 [Kwoniella shivajii]